jgi:transcriptional regulator with XRE-family HTH domain
MNVPSSIDDQHRKRFIGERIKAFRLKRGLSQEELAKALGYDSQMAVAYMEDGERGLKVEMLLKIAAILDVKIDDFFPNSVIRNDHTNSAIKLRASKLDKEMEKAIISFTDAARAKFGKRKE